MAEADHDISGKTKPDIQETEAIRAKVLLRHSRFVFLLVVVVVAVVVAVGPKARTFAISSNAEKGMIMSRTFILSLD